MMEAVTVPESWEVVHDPDPKWVQLQIQLSQRNPTWSAHSPGGDTVTVVRDLETDSYTISYDCAANREVDTDTVHVERKARAIEIADSIVDAVTHGGATGVNSFFAEYGRTDRVSRQQTAVGDQCEQANNC